MTCYKLTNGILHAVPDPIDDGGCDYSAQIYKSGYRSQFSSLAHGSDGAEITIYSTEAEGKPEYYIDVTGRVHQLATLVADDFPSLVATLQAIQPLIALLALDQQTVIQNELIDARHQSAD
jgi:hypothetical protein